jgi:5-methylcytosine-specific restriction endonuclease McrA
MQEYPFGINPEDPFGLKGLNSTDRYDDKKKRVPIPIGLIKDLLLKCKGKCEKCKLSFGVLKPELHHKNQNPSDNRKANIIVLCPNCHNKAHNKDKPIKNSGSGKTIRKSKPKTNDALGLGEFEPPKFEPPKFF